LAPLTRHLERIEIKEEPEFATHRSHRSQKGKEVGVLAAANERQSQNAVHQDGL
jgi:hypothetical protein